LKWKTSINEPVMAAMNWKSDLFRWCTFNAEAGAMRLELGRLWLIWCTPDRPSTPGHPNIPGHPNKWMIVWRRGVPEWDSKTKWAGSGKPGLYWKECSARLERKRGVDPEDARCQFPNCDCAKLSVEEKAAWERRRAEGIAYREAWKRRRQEHAPK
jgi:hypothetical protein